MDQKPVIQYVGQFYVYGSEVKAPKKKQPAPKVFLPKKPKTEKERRIYVDPVAVGGIVLAVVVLVALVVGAVQLTVSMKQYNQETEKLTELKRENAKLEHAYRTALDLDAIQERAEALGMIPAEEAEKMTVRVSVPEHEEEPTAWENFLWFLSGLLGPAEEPEA